MELGSPFCVRQQELLRVSKVRVEGYIKNLPSLAFPKDGAKSWQVIGPTFQLFARAWVKEKMEGLKK